MPRTKMSCHRGAHQVAPENTYAAAEGAIAYGADFIEIDVRMSADGVLYILHDETVDRTTNGTGPIELMTSSDVDALDAGSWFGPAFTDQRIPRLTEYLAWLRGRCGIYVEIKRAPVEPVRDLVRQYGFADNCYFLSLDDDIARDVIRLAPDLPVMGLFRTEGSIDATANAGFKIVELLPDEMTTANIARARDRGLQIQAFHPRDDPDVFLAMLEAGVDYANLDHPQTFIDVRRQHDEASRATQCR